MCLHNEVFDLILLVKESPKLLKILRGLAVLRLQIVMKELQSDKFFLLFGQLELERLEKIFEWTNVFEVLLLLSVALKLRLSLGKLGFQLGNFLALRLHFLSDFVRRLFDDFVEYYAGSNAHSFSAKMQGLNRFLEIGLHLADAANDACLRFARKRVLQNASELAIAEVDVVVGLARNLLLLSESVDHI